MRRILAIVFTMSFLISCVMVNRDFNLNPFSKINKSVYKISAYMGGTCSAFTLNHKDKYFMVTAGHCCEGSAQENIIYTNFPDICTIKLSEVPKGMKFLKLSNKEPKAGDRVYTTGYPKGIGPLSYEGFINTTTPYEYIISIHFLPGQSGSALVNSDGDVVSLGSMYYTWIEGGMIGPSLSQLHKFLDNSSK